MASVGTRKPFKLVDQTPVLSNGEWEPSTVTIYRGFGEVRKKGGSRIVQNDQTQLQKLFELRFRNQGNISLNANVKLVYDGNTLTVISIEKEKEKGFYYILTFEAKKFS